MNVLIVNNCLENTGIGVYTASLYSALQTMDQEIKLRSWESKYIEMLYAKSRNHLGLAYFHEVPRVISQLYFIGSISRKCDLYHISTACFTMGIRLLKPFVATVHDLIPFTSPRWSGDHLIKRSMRELVNAQRLICVSYYAKEELLHFIDIEPSKVKVVYNGMDHNCFKQRDKSISRNTLGLSADNVLVLHVGSEEPRKNIPTLIQAFHKFHRVIPNSVLIRVGERTEAVQRLVREYGLEGKVIYYKNVTNLEYFYNAADMCVFPSTLEGFGFPPLEAMASGCPVIASNSTSIPEVVGDAGILLDPLDVDDIAYWMGKVHSEEELRSKVIAEGFKQSNKFSWDNCARDTFKVYEEALAEVC